MSYLPHSVPTPSWAGFPLFASTVVAFQTCTMGRFILIQYIVAALSWMPPILHLLPQDSIRTMHGNAWHHFWGRETRAWNFACLFARWGWTNHDEIEWLTSITRSGALGSTRGLLVASNTVSLANGTVIHCYFVPNIPCIPGDKNKEWLVVVAMTDSPIATP